MDADADRLRQFERHLLRHGVTAYLPTTVTATPERTLAALERLGRHIQAGKNTERHMALGIHLEGPFISHAKRGVHPPENLLPPSPERLQGFWESSTGTLRMMTLAPELPGSVETISHAIRLGICSSLGHSDATYEQAGSAIEAGAKHATHTFNAMRQVDHRQPGIAGAVLANPGVSADIIADGIHVHPAMIDLFIRAKGLERTILISDAISATGMPDGSYALGDLQVDVRQGRCECRGKLAGSVLTLDRAIRNTMLFAGSKLQESVRFASFNPAKLLGLTAQRGMIAEGRRADIVVLTPEGNVVHTILGGETVF
jgi:N-acetylglucosamine-6-phosphate deacetylase